MIIKIILLTLLTLLASNIGTFAGFGISTIMIPVLLLFFKLPETLLFVGILHLFDDIWKIILFKKGIRWKLIISFGIPGIIASYIGASLILNISQIVLSRILAAFFLAYVIFIIIKPNWKLRESYPIATIGGTLSGFFAGIFGVGGAIRGIFLSAFNLPKEAYLFTAGAISAVIDITRISKYVVDGIRIDNYILIGMILFIPASFIGAYLGYKIVNRIPQKYFRLVIGIFLLIISLKLLLFP